MRNYYIDYELEELGCLEEESELRISKKGVIQLVSELLKKEGIRQITILTPNLKEVERQSDE